MGVVVLGMNAGEVNALGKIEGRLGRLEALQEANVRSNTELTASVNRLVEKLDKSDDKAREADQRARSAHHRIDDVQEQLKATNGRIDDEKRERKADKHWMIGTMLTAVGATAGIVTLILKEIGK